MSTILPRLVFAAPDGTCFIRLLSRSSSPPWRAPPRLTSAPCRPPNPNPFSFTEHTSFGRVQEWVQRKMKLAAGESFQATYACDLLDGSGIREVMLDDGPSCPLPPLPLTLY